MAAYDDPQEATVALVVEAYRLWLQYETRTDDITAIVIQARLCLQRQRVCKPVPLQWLPSSDKRLRVEEAAAL